MINTFGAKTFFRAWNTKHVMSGTQETLCVVHQKCILKKNENVNFFKHEQNETKPKLMARLNTFSPKYFYLLK